MATIPTELELLAPFEIWEVLLDNATIKFHAPLVLQPEWLPDDPDEPSEQKYLCVERPDLNISVFADNRDDLYEFVHSEIRFIWEHFVQADDSQLNRDTKAIKQVYLKLAEVVDG